MNFTIDEVKDQAALGTRTFRVLIEVKSQTELPKALEYGNSMELKRDLETELNKLGMSDFGTNFKTGMRVLDADGKRPLDASKATHVERIVNVVKSR